MLEWFIIGGLVVVMYLVIYKYEKRMDKMHQLIEENKSRIDKNHEKIMTNHENITKNKEHIKKNHSYIERMWVTIPNDKQDPQ